MRARTEELGEARRTRFHKMLQHLTVQEKPMPIFHVSVPTHTMHVVSVELEQKGSSGQGGNCLVPRRVGRFHHVNSCVSLQS